MNENLRTLTLLLSLFVLLPKAKKTAEDIFSPENQDVINGIGINYIRSEKQAQGFAYAFAKKVKQYGLRNLILSKPEERMLHSFKVVTNYDFDMWKNAGSHYWNKYAKYNIGFEKN